jgi:hypothetical protein
MDGYDSLRITGADDVASIGISTGLSIIHLSYFYVGED